MSRGHKAKRLVTSEQLSRLLNPKTVKLLPPWNLSYSQVISSSIPTLLSCRAPNAVDNGRLNTDDVQGFFVGLDTATNTVSCRASNTSLLALFARLCIVWDSRLVC